jgi:hypothetical protein
MFVFKDVRKLKQKTIPSLEKIMLDPVKKRNPIRILSIVLEEIVKNINEEKERRNPKLLLSNVKQEACLNRIIEPDLKCK